jgi:ABC-type antimicrobial peptide transport system permease subunit
VKSLVANAALAIVTVAGVLALVVVHEVLAVLENDSDRFALARRWLAVAVAVLVVIVAAVIAARFYYLRT